jgi:hypothetical protein
VPQVEANYLSSPLDDSQANSIDDLAPAVALVAEKNRFQGDAARVERLRTDRVRGYAAAAAALAATLAAPNNGASSFSTSVMGTCFKK